MLRSTRARRTIQTLLTLLFLLTWGESVAALHQCPIHDAVPSGTAVVGAAHEHGDAEQEGGPCSCVGEACPAPVAMSPAAEAWTWRAVLVDRGTEPTHRSIPLRRGAATRLLPFANGPPSLA